MKKIFALVAVLSVATGCATWRDGDVIATVAGSDITVAELRDEFATLAEVPDVARLFKNLDPGSLVLDEDRLDLTNPNVRVLLSERIPVELAEAELERLGLVPDEAAVAAAGADIEASLAAFVELGQQDPNQGIPATLLDDYRAMPEALRDTYAHSDAVRQALRAHLATEDGSVPASPQALYDEDPVAFDELCISAVVTPDEPTAREALAGLRAGTPLGEVAADVGGQSTEPCFEPANASASVLEAVEDARAGDLRGPIDLGGSFAALEIKSRTPRSFDESRSVALSVWMRSTDDLYNDWLRTADHADVEVRTAFGSWDPQTLSVVPPARPGTSR